MAYDRICICVIIFHNATLPLDCVQHTLLSFGVLIRLLRKEAFRETCPLKLVFPLVTPLSTFTYYTQLRLSVSCRTATVSFWWETSSIHRAL
jgi:hypothetical protein